MTQPNNSDANPKANNDDSDATQHLHWDSAWQPDRDEDYAAVVREYRRPATAAPLPSQPYAPATYSPPPSSPYAPLSAYPSDEATTQLKQDEFKAEPTYQRNSTVSPASQASMALPRRTSAQRWMAELVVFIIVFAVLSSWGWWPVWLFLFWPMFGGGRNSCDTTSRSS